MPFNFSGAKLPINKAYTNKILSYQDVVIIRLVINVAKCNFSVFKSLRLLYIIMSFKVDVIALPVCRREDSFTLANQLQQIFYSGNTGSGSPLLWKENWGDDF